MPIHTGDIERVACGVIWVSLQHVANVVVGLHTEEPFVLHEVKEGIHNGSCPRGLTGMRMQNA